ncbi:hypothetical protein [Psychrobacillus sp. FSL H8-0487]
MPSIVGHIHAAATIYKHLYACCCNHLQSFVFACNHLLAVSNSLFKVDI